MVQVNTCTELINGFLLTIAYAKLADNKTVPVIVGFDDRMGCHLSLIERWFPNVHKVNTDSMSECDWNIIAIQAAKTIDISRFLPGCGTEYRKALEQFKQHAAM